MAFLPALAAIATIGSAGVGIASSLGAFGKKSASPNSIPKPSQPKPNVATDSSQQAQGINARGAFSLINTGPQGLLSDPTTARNTLLGS